MKKGISVLHFEDQHLDISPVVYDIYFILREKAITSYHVSDFKMIKRDLSLIHI